MIGPKCDEECPTSTPIVAALVGAFATVLAAGIGPWLAARHHREREERERADRLARLEGLLMTKEDDDDDEG